MGIIAVGSSSFHSITYLIIVTFLFSMYVSMHTGLEMGGEMNLAAGIQIAHPIKHEKKALEMIGKKLKKNSVALDIVDFGEDEDGKPEKL
ncbi:hypothetical protein Gotur_020686, partial [Gossypium turneri]